MGYRPPEKTIRLTFEDDAELSGLEVTTRSLSLGTYLNLLGVGEVDRSSVADALDEFTQALTGWNLEDKDGAPVPPTREAALQQDNDLMQKVTGRWLDHLAGVVQGTPLPESSPAGEPSPAASIPMAPLSESQAS